MLTLYVAVCLLHIENRRFAVNPQAPASYDPKWFFSADGIMLGADRTSAGSGCAPICEGLAQQL